MFERVNNIITQGSPSFQSNNLSSIGEVLCYVRLNEVSIIDDKRFMKIASSRSQLYEASIVTIGKEKCIVVASNQGVQFWSLNGETMHFFHTLGETGTYMRGITSVSNFAAVGTSSGHILVFRFDPAETLATGHLGTQTLDPSFHSSVTALASSKSIICGGNENGDIFVHNVDFRGELNLACKFPGFGTSVTGMVCQAETDTIFACFLSGHVRIYRPNIAEMSIEITAHVRSITGIIIDPQGKFFATCGEDQFFQVWKTPDFTSSNYVNDMKNNLQLFCEKIENRLCTGLAFLSDNRIAVASYDDESIVVFQKINNV